MARRKADYDGLLVQEFLNKSQAMAYCNMTEDQFAELIQPFVHVYRSKYQAGDYFLPELRNRKLEMVVIEPTMM